MSNARFFNNQITNPALLFAVSVIVGLTAISSATGQCDPTISVTDPGFENNSLLSYSDVLNNFQLHVGNWGAENGAIVAPQNGVTPFCGSKMLRMESDGLTVTQTVQVIDVSSLAYDDR